MACPQHYRATLVVALLVSGLAATPAHAQDIIVDNLAGIAEGLRVLNGSGPTGDRIAAAFQTDGQARLLTDTTIPLGLMGTGLWQVEVSLVANNGGQPGALLADLGTATLNDDLIIPFTFTPSSPTPLAPNTIYWIVLGGERIGVTANVRWNTDSSSLFDGVGSVPSATATATSNNGGASWTVFPDSAEVQKFRVRATVQPVASAAPEPGSLSLLALTSGYPLGAVGGAVIRRSRVARRRSV
jgi:hypothetical protein